MLATKSVHHCSSLIKFGHVLPAGAFFFPKNEKKTEHKPSKQNNE